MILRHSGVERVVLLALLAIWMLPLFAVAVTSIRSLEDLNTGNYWGWPSETRFLDNYASVLFGSVMGRLILNSFLITIPAVAATIVLSTMAGFALAIYRFRCNFLVLSL